MLDNILADIRESNKEKPFQLYVRLIKERLDLALVSYYHDITMKANHFENLSDDKKDILKIVKKVIR